LKSVGGKIQVTIMVPECRRDEMQNLLGQADKAHGGSGLALPVADSSVCGCHSLVADATLATSVGLVSFKDGKGDVCQFELDGTRVNGAVNGRVWKGPWDFDPSKGCLKSRAGKIQVIISVPEENRQDVRSLLDQAEKPRCTSDRAKLAADARRTPQSFSFVDCDGDLCEFELDGAVIRGTVNGRAWQGPWAYDCANGCLKSKGKIQLITTVPEDKRKGIQHLMDQASQVASEAPAARIPMCFAWIRRLQRRHCV
jgi:hypothetical protein